MGIDKIRIEDQKWSYNMVDGRWIRMKESPAVAKRIWVTFQREGIHKYPAAGTDPKLADVSFLQYPHRHIFHFRVEIDVTHDDRDIEFIQFKRWLESLYQDATLELNNKSCEMIAGDLISLISSRYPNRQIICSVSEDDENGATITYTPS